MAGLTDLLSIIPGIGTSIAGGIQGVGEGLSQIINMARRDSIASDIETAGTNAVNDYQGAVNPILGDMTRRLRYLNTSGKEGFGEISGTLRQGRDDVLKELGGVSSEVKGRADKALDKRDTDITKMMDMLNQSIATARENVGEVKTLGTESLNRLREDGSKMLEELEGRVDAVTAGIRTNMTERAGATVSGMRVDAEKRINDYIANARAEGVRPEEIDANVAKMREGVVASTSKTWGEAFTAMTGQIASAATAGNEMVTSLMNTQVAAFSENEQNYVNLVAGALKDVSDKEFGAATTFESASAARAELANGLISTISGTMEFVSGKIADVIAGEASAQATNTAARIQFEKNINESLNQVGNLRMGAAQYVTDTFINSRYQASGMRAGFMFQFPNLVGLTGNGMSMIQNGAANIMQANQEEKGSFGFSILASGANSSCIDVTSMIWTPGGLVPLAAIQIGMYALGGDKKYHKIINMDIGHMPSRQPEYYCISASMGAGSVLFQIIATGDHTFDGRRADSLKIGDKINTAAGEAIIFGTMLMPYRVGGDLELDGCDSYVAHGVVVDSMIAKFPEELKQGLLDLAKHKGLVLADVE